jgi:hypothetical protein
MRLGAVGKSRWEDRFRTPTESDLLSGYAKPLGACVEAVRAGLAELSGVRESLTWQGVPWRWTFIYRHEADTQRGLAYLVPQPDKPLLAIPLPAEVVAALQPRKLSRSIRDVIVHAPSVAGLRWATWEIQSETQVEELLSLVVARHAAIGEDANV